MKTREREERDQKKRSKSSYIEEKKRFVALYRLCQPALKKPFYLNLCCQKASRIIQNLLQNFLRSYHLPYM